MNSNPSGHTIRAFSILTALWTYVYFFKKDPLAASGIAARERSIQQRNDSLATAVTGGNKTFNGTGWM
ncbi:MAG TPA: hypothetical protein HPP90_12535 [Deltaproteobacteria bacterium]|nr:hypothetical protein [Deltaproteobacteria bacterium]